MFSPWAPSTDAVASAQAQRWRAVAAASLGNALEWFDFVIYGYFAATIARLFFPARNDLESLLIALATFGITFFVRPLGAILLGAFADRHGRKKAFMLTIASCLPSSSARCFSHHRPGRCSRTSFPAIALSARIEPIARRDSAHRPVEIAQP